MSILDISPVVPVVVIEDADTAVPVARALAAGGLGAVELTLRTPAALDAIERIASDVPEIVVGAGTIVSPEDAKAATAAGAQFLVSPGFTPALLEAMTETGLPLLPGCATLSEILALLERGISEVKFFPAAASGGVDFLRAVHGPLPGVRFCPTGGIRVSTAPDYLELPNVGCVGGTWLTPADAVRAADWDHIESLARQASGLRPNGGTR